MAVKGESSQSATERFTLVERVGRGSFGTVWLANDRERDDVVAIKIIDLEMVSDDIDDVRREVAVMAQLSSPYVTRYHGNRSMLNLRLPLAPLASPTALGWGQ